MAKTPPRFVRIFPGSLYLALMCYALSAAVGQCVASAQARFSADSDHASALDLAEAAVNYEIARSRRHPGSLDCFPGKTKAFRSGAFAVYVTDIHGRRLRPGQSEAFIVGTGIAGESTRTVRIRAERRPDGSLEYRGGWEELGSRSAL